MIATIFLSSILALSNLVAATPVERRQTSGTTLFPNYLIPVQPSQADTAFGSVYSPDVYPGQAVDVGFDVPAGTGSTCDLVFYLPGNGGSSYSLGGERRFTAQQLSGPLSTRTTWNNRPAPFGDLYEFTLTEGQTTIIGTVGCAQGQQQAFELSSVDESTAQWFEASASPAVGIVLIQH